MATFEIQWKAPEYEFREKSASWYWLSIIIAAIIIAFSAWEKNFLFGLFIVIAEILFIVWGSREPRSVYFTANETGFTIDKQKNYGFKEFGSMSIGIEGGDWAEIIFIPVARFKIPVKILFPGDRVSEFRVSMKTILKEAPYEPTLIDAIEKLLRF